MNQLGIQIDDDNWGSSAHESSSSSSSSSSSENRMNIDDTTSKDASSDHNQNQEPKINEMTKYTANENKQVNRWRRIVIISILVVGAIVGSITYITLHNAQTSDSTDAVRCCFLLKTKNVVPDVSPLHFLTIPKRSI
jgi:hypothetical protein